MNSILDHLRLAARSLLREPLPALSVVATLAVCIGGATAAFSIVNGVLIRGLPFRDPEQLTWVTSIQPGNVNMPFSLPELMDLEAGARTIDLAAFGTWSAALETSGMAQRLQGLRLSANGFRILGAKAAAGRLLEPSDDKPGAPPVAVLGYGVWLRQFAGDSSIIGKPIVLNGQPRTVVGVLPPHFPLPIRTIDVVVPLSPDRDPRRHVRASVSFLRVFGRLRPAATPATARAELNRLTAELRDRFPVEYRTRLGVDVTPMREFLIGDHRQTLLVLLGCSGLLLAIALANVLNLLMIRATVRQGAIAIRRALGASTAQIAAALAAEGLILAIAGASIGATIAYAGVRSFSTSPSLGLPRLDEVRIDGLALAFTLGVTALAALLFSLIPLGIARRITPESALRAAGRGSVASGQARARAAFIVTQVSLAVLLTTVATTVAQSLARLQSVDFGFRTDSVFVARLSLPPSRYPDPVALLAFHDRVAASLDADPAVLQAGLVSVAPLTGILASVNFGVANRVAQPGNENPSALFRVISPGYFGVIGATVVTGRSFTESDDAASLPVAIISRTLAETQFPGVDPIGQRLMIGDNPAGPRPVTIVGVLEDLRHDRIDQPPTQDIYVPLRQIHPNVVQFVTNNQFWVVRVPGDPAAYAPTFLRHLERIDRSVAVSGSGALESHLARALATRRVGVASLVGFATVALLLSAIGVYGVMAYGVEQRRRELGLRLALGATPASVVGLIVRNALALGVTGTILGVVGALLSGQALAGMLFGVSPRDPLILAGVSAGIVALCAIASWLPAWRASRIAPIEALSG